MNIYLFLWAGGGLVIGLVLGLVAYRFWSRSKLNSAEQEARKILQTAADKIATQKKEAALQAKEELYKNRSRFEKETRERRQELKKLTERINHREENLDRKVRMIDGKMNELRSREGKFQEREKRLMEKEDQARELVERQRVKLQRISGLSREEAKNFLLASMREVAEKESVALARQIESEAREKAEKEARKIITLAIQRYASEQVSESTVSTVALPNDEMKGRIIGREGRNIRAFQAATGVDLIVDDTPEMVVLSAFDPVRREIARLSLTRLVTDGRIHPPRIEGVVAKVEKEMEKELREVGEQTAFDVGIHGLKPELIKLLGRLKYRTSYGQNVLQHSREVAYLMGIMAAELGLNVQTAKKIGLLHDIGKAIDHETEGSHAQIGANLARKYGLPEVVVNAIASHHGEVEARTVYDVLGQAGDAVSAARPGARRESMVNYVKRLEKLEAVALAFNGVRKAYAIQAGREVRVVVEPDKVDDNEAAQVARNISKKIEEELDYPGQVRVTVVRETRAVEYAK
jgi:ribonuclease Y